MPTTIHIPATMPKTFKVITINKSESSTRIREIEYPFKTDLVTSKVNRQSTNEKMHNYTNMN